MSDLLASEHVGAIVVIALLITGLVVAGRRSPGSWLKLLAVLLVVDEVSWWIYLASGGGEPGQRAQPLPLQLCDVAIFVAAAALWTRNRLLVEVTYFWALAGTIQAILTPDLPQHFPSYPYFQYYLAHGGVVGAALVLVVGMRLHPRPWAVLRVAAVTVGYAALVGVIDLLTGADYMYLRSKPPSPTPFDLLGPWPVYVLGAALVGIVLFAILDAPFRIRRARRPIALGLFDRKGGATMSDQPEPRRAERRISSPEHRARYQAAKDAPTEHKPKLVTSRSVADQVHGAGTVGRFNTWLAVGITRSVGTMWAAYLFTLIAIGGGVAVVTQNAFLTALSVLISQTFLQLVLLPIIIVGQNVISASQDARAEADHLTLTTLHAINVQQLEILKQHRKMLERQEEILNLLQKRAAALPATGSGG